MNALENYLSLMGKIETSLKYATYGYSAESLAILHGLKINFDNYKKKDIIIAYGQECADYKKQLKNRTMSEIDYAVCLAFAIKKEGVFEDVNPLYDEEGNILMSEEASQFNREVMVDTTLNMVGGMKWSVPYYDELQKEIVKTNKWSETDYKINQKLTEFWSERIELRELLKNNESFKNDDLRDVFRLKFGVVCFGCELINQHKGRNEIQKVKSRGGNYGRVSNQ